MLGRDGEGAQPIASNARLAHQFRAVRTELTTSLELMRCMRALAIEYSQYNIYSARIQ